jgi:hypothetical protein
MSAPCIFCGKQRPLSDEHLFPEWTARLLGVRRVQVRGRKLNAPVRRWQKIGTFGQTANAVCTLCNNGWMSRLENVARPILSPMILKLRSRRLTSDARVVIAAWLWKVAILHEDAAGGSYFNGAERTCLSNDEDPPTDGVHVWVGAYRGDLVGNLRGGPSTFTAPDGRTTPGYLMSMTLGRFAAQVLCVREIPNTNIETVSRYYFAPGELLLWPDDVDVDLDWPPEETLTHALFNQWHLRWNSEESAARYPSL